MTAGITSLIKSARDIMRKDKGLNGDLDRQTGSQFYERAALSRNKMAMLKMSGHRKPEDIVTAEEEIKQPSVLEFLGLKDEYWRAMPWKACRSRRFLVAKSLGKSRIWSNPAISSSHLFSPTNS